MSCANWIMIKGAARDTRMLSPLRLTVLFATIAAVYFGGGSLFSMARMQSLLDPVLVGLLRVRDSDQLILDIATMRFTVHFLEYFVVYLLANRLIGLRPLPALLFCAVLALADEGHQYFLPDRSFRLRDLGLDTAGAATALILTAGWARLAWSPRRPSADSIESL